MEQSDVEMALLFLTKVLHEVCISARMLPMESGMVIARPIVLEDSYGSGEIK